MIKKFNDYVKIDTKSNTLLLKRIDNRLTLLYFGKKIKDKDNYDFLIPNKIDGFFGSNDDYKNALSIFSFNGEGSNKESLVLIVTPLKNDSINSTFIKNNETVNISEDDAIKTVSNNIKELNQEFILEFDNYVNIETSEIIRLDNEIFANLDVIKTPIKGKNPLCWKLTAIDIKYKKLDAYVDIMTGDLIGSKNR